MTTWTITTRAMIVVALFFLASLLTSSALGLFPDVQWEAPILGVCVGIPFAAIMFGVGVSVCRELIGISGIAEGVSRGQLLGTLAASLMKRPTLRSVFASITPLLLAFQFWQTEDGFLPRFPGATETTLFHAMRIEFLLIHGFPFLIFWANIAITKSGIPRIAGGAIFLLVATLYAGAAVNIEGSFNGALIFLYLLIPDLISFARNDSNEYVRSRLAMRWCLQFVGMMASLIVSQSNLLQNAETFLAGRLFFLWIAIMEFFRLADIPLDIADGAHSGESSQSHLAMPNP